jgi:hypothetical protein
MVECTDVSEEPASYVIRVEDYAKPATRRNEAELSVSLVHCSALTLNIDGSDL